MDYPHYPRLGLPVRRPYGVAGQRGELPGEGDGHVLERPRGAEAILQVRAATLCDDDRSARPSHSAGVCLCPPLLRHLGRLSRGGAALHPQGRSVHREGLRRRLQVTTAPPLPPNRRQESPPTVHASGRSRRVASLATNCIARQLPASPRRPTPVAAYRTSRPRPAIAVDTGRLATQKFSDYVRLLGSVRLVGQQPAGQKILRRAIVAIMQLEAIARRAKPARVGKLRKGHANANTWAFELRRAPAVVA